MTASLPAFLDARFNRHQIMWPAVAAQLPAGELAHDASHIGRVYTWALRLADEGGVSADLAGAMALVHDLAFIPKDSPERSQGGERSAQLAGAVLAAAGYNDAEIADIAEAVRTSSWSRGLAPTNALGIVLQDADRLDAIGVIGLMRTIACGQYMSRPDRPGQFYQASDPLASTDRALDDRSYAIDHCYVKLLSLAAGMHLPTAKREAELRHQALLTALQALNRELG